MYLVFRHFDPNTGEVAIPKKSAEVNAVYARYFPKNPPARIFISVPAWPGPFDIEIDCIAALHSNSQLKEYICSRFFSKFIQNRINGKPT